MDMFFGFDLKEIFLFPVRDEEARKHFLIGALVSVSAFIIPILPYFVLFGYAMRIVKQVLNHESPHMVPWDDWGGMFKDGAKVFAVRFIYSLPIILLIMPMMILSIAMPFMMDNTNGGEADAFFALFMAVSIGSFCLIVPISIAISILIPAAEMHMVAADEFSAGFRVKEWLAVFRANTGGFIAAFGIYFVATFIMAIAFQIIVATLILACLLPFLIPALTIYLVLIMYIPIAQAYREGKAKLSISTPVKTDL
jgi:hypothetical protein